MILERSMWSIHLCPSCLLRWHQPQCWSRNLKNGAQIVRYLNKIKHDKDQAWCLIRGEYCRMWLPNTTWHTRVWHQSPRFLQQLFSDTIVTICYIYWPRWYPRKLLLYFVSLCYWHFSCQSTLMIASFQSITLRLLYWVLFYSSTLYVKLCMSNSMHAAVELRI